jgi:hypothetical protein
MFNYPMEGKIFLFAVVTLKTVIRMTKSGMIDGWIVWHMG